MKYITFPILVFCLVSCESAEKITTPAKTEVEIIKTVDTEEVEIVEETEDSSQFVASVIRINSTSQSWNPGQPWEKGPPQNLRSLGALVGPNMVLTVGEMVADSTYLELELPNGSRTAEAKIVAVDYAANLALLTVKNEEDAAEFFENTKPLDLADPASIGDSLQILQVEDNGTALLTNSTLRSVEVLSSFLAEQHFLTYLLKGSMQSAISSFSLPVLKDGKFAGILLSYDSDEQISDVLPIDIISRFLENAKDEVYEGFPSLGVSIARTEDPSFRSFLKLAADQGGIYVNKVRKGGSADLAGVKVGDVLLAVDGFEIDRRGYYQHPHYGPVFWAHIVKGQKSAGDEINLSVLRGGEVNEIKATLASEEPFEKLVPEYLFDRAPNFLVKGGFIFQELTRPVLEAFGEEWSSRAPLNLLDVYENQEKYEGVERVIFLSGAIPTPATIGYEPLRNLIVKKVNGIEIDSMKTLIEAFEKPNADKLHSIEFREEDFTVYLDEEVSSSVDSVLLQRGLNRLSRAE